LEERTSKQQDAEVMMMRKNCDNNDMEKVATPDLRISKN
jgi:hypothetical protein